MKDTMIGVDLAKRVFQVHGASMTGEVKFRKKLTREQFRAFTVSADHTGFVVSRALGTARIGRLTGAAFERLQAVRARIHPEADIAADRRAERRREVVEERALRSTPPARPFVVETVRPRTPAVAR